MSAPHPMSSTVAVFGPERPAAGRMARFHLDQAIAAREADPWDYYGTAARLAYARAVARLYWEYTGESYPRA